MIHLEQVEEATDMEDLMVMLDIIRQILDLIQPAEVAVDMELMQMVVMEMEQVVEEVDISQKEEMESHSMEAVVEVMEPVAHMGLIMEMVD